MLKRRKPRLPQSDLLAALACDDGALTVKRAYEPHRNVLTQVRNVSGTNVISNFDYANDAGGRRTVVARSGTAFEPVGPAFNLYGYNSRSELAQAGRYLGTAPNDTSAPVPGQWYGYAYDDIGNRQTAEEGGAARTASYTANAPLTASDDQHLERQQRRA